jgi:hypothetical protein
LIYEEIKVVAIIFTGLLGVIAILLIAMRIFYWGKTLSKTVASLEQKLIQMKQENDKDKL